MYPQCHSNLFIEWPILSSFIKSKVTLVEKESIDECFTSGNPNSLFFKFLIYILTYQVLLFLRWKKSKTNQAVALFIQCKDYFLQE